jgi:hypothetical protein
MLAQGKSSGDPIPISKPRVMVCVCDLSYMEGKGRRIQRQKFKIPPEK